MCRILAIALGIASFLSPLGLIAVGFIAPAFLDAQSVLANSALIDQLHLFFGALGLALTAIYIVFTIRSSGMPQEKRWLWVAVLVLANFFSLPFFWLWYIWPSSRPSSLAII